ncbi:uncharacterized protein KY384_005540 [Bacidia gigantensis]|uniref:uncharacterized protein n=1 Tax=Bacidia gigantensis TaxID=2732470 RepID=UPI001D04A662|nr:uncharacterized protein KY384_005540 [Bacidia gigantensis]KAG8530058.1 hypothetical protein KY384_005540 [Bacidia gigantensis]
MAELTVRPLPPGSNVSKTIFNVYVAPENLIKHDLREGSTCTLQSQKGTLGPVIVDRSPDKALKSAVIQLTQPLQRLYRLKLGDKVTLKHTGDEFPVARTVTIIETEGSGDGCSGLPIGNQDVSMWSQVLSKVLCRAEMVVPGMRFDEVDIAGEKRSFSLETVNGTSEFQVWTAMAPLEVSVIELGKGIFGKEETLLKIERDSVGGLDEQLDQLDIALSEFCMESAELADGEPQTEPGILIFGLPGTGKSFLMEKISQAGFKSVFHIDRKALRQHRSYQSAANFVQGSFVHAARDQPSCILIEDLDSELYKNENGRSFISHIEREFDRLKDTRIVVVASCRSPANIDEELRKPSFFWREIELTVPNINARAQILKIISGFPKNAPNAKLDFVAGRTHGYVGGDLAELHHAAGKEAKKRIKAANTEDEKHDSANFETVWERVEADYEVALRRIRPSAMREVVIETPHVSWNDVAGQDQVKNYLKAAVVWPYKYPEQMERRGIEHATGLLLYGPPGCSKTMIARAVATESGLNFMAVKGAELLNMYVGESERAIREIFAKARAVSPSILFFDEIDAIGASRAENQQHSGVHTVTTLLTELDGLEKSKSIFVLAATNRPEVLDPALTRPGRLNSMLYVGPPDELARLAILRKSCQRLSLAETVDLAAIASMTDRRSGAELVEICQRAARLEFQDWIQTREDQGVHQNHLLQALEEVPSCISAEMENVYEVFAGSRVEKKAGSWRNKEM